MKRRELQAKLDVLAGDLRDLWIDVRDKRDLTGVERRLERLYEEVRAVAVKA